MNETILVTGGLGYIGSHTVVELLNNNYNVIVIDNLSNSSLTVKVNIEKITGKTLKYLNIDLLNLNDILKSLHDIKIDGIIHFAAFKAVGESVKEPLKYYENNIISLINILKLCKLNDCKKLVFSSSCTVYGQADKMPITENTPLKVAESPYGATKQMCERICEDFAKVTDTKILALRYFNPIGAHNSGLLGENPNGIPNNLVPYICQTASHKREKLTIYGKDYNTNDGTAVRDYINIEDLANAHIKAISSINKIENKFDVINVGTGKPSSVLEIVKIFEKVNNLKLNYDFGERREGDIEIAYADISKAQSVLNWTPLKSMEDSLKSAWRWEENQNQNNANTNPIR